MSIAIAYHQATKYAPDTIGNHPGLDWSRQPLPYKDYDSLTPVELAAFLPFDPNPFTGRPRKEEGVPIDGEIGLNALSRWLFASYGITGVIPNQPRPTYLRAAPSAGGLYPAEIYVTIRECPGCPPGLYGYDPRRHRLIPLWDGVDVPAHLATACYENAAVAAAPICLITTGVFERSRWRYGERAYRRILLDSGHLIGNGCLMAPALGLRCHLTAAFCDERLQELLRLEPEVEAPLAVMALNRHGSPERPTWSALPSSRAPTAATEPDHDESTLLYALHKASRLANDRPRLIPRGEELRDSLESRYGWRNGLPLMPDAKRRGDGGNLAADPFTAILQRRSTRRFLRTSISREQLARILCAAYQPQEMGLGEQPALDTSHLMTFVAVLAVTGIASGLYYLAPHGLELRPVGTHCTRDAVQHLCLGQELGGDAAAIVFHTADLEAAVEHLGDRAYRYLHLDAGILGERLDLAALNDGCGASGIGGFFDDQVTELLGIPSEQAVVYITTIGVPAPPEP